MAVHQIDSLEEYVRYLQQTPAGVEALFRDLLIGVTNFFRDPEAFEALEKQVIPQAFCRQAPGAVDSRLGARLLHRRGGLFHRHPASRSTMETLKQSFKVQVFATDIDRQAIDHGPRRPLSGQHRRRHLAGTAGAVFRGRSRTASAYRIHKAIRDMLVFSEQDVIKDPPFSKLDLISCRNLLIYMGGELQKKLIPLFHYALNPGGIALPGHLRDRGRVCGLFSTVDRKSKLYQRKEDRCSAQRPGVGPVSSARDGDQWGTPAGLPGRRLPPEGSAARADRTGACCNRYAPVGALVNGAATSSTSTAAPACTWNRPRARPA